MHKNILISFTAGLAIGSITAWIVFRSQREEKDSKMTDDDITTENQKTVKVILDKEEFDKYSTFVSERGYMNYSTMHKKKEDKNMNYKCYIISPEDFDELNGYTKLSLTYYSDDVLADEDDEILDKEAIGVDFVNGFGEYENDSVFVRNDELECDYEILRDNRSYSEVTGREAHKTEV